MADDSVTDAFRRASEIVRGVPKHLQETAFNRALDLLLGQAPTHAPPADGRKTNQRGRQQTTRRVTKAPNGANDQVVGQLLRDLDRTKYPEITADTPALWNALAVLRAGRRDHKVDGLLSSQIARILTEKFRIRTADSTVRMALGRAGKYVNRVPDGRSYTYQLMAPGEKFLEAPLPSESSLPASASRARRAGARRSKRAETDTSSGSRARRNAPAKVRPGPKAALDDLVQSGFFSQPRTLGDIQTHLEVQRGYRYAVTDLSPTMTRAVRSNQLKRSRRSDGQYEYQV